MSLDSFFDSLDDESQFEAWRNAIKQKLIHLKNIIPPDNHGERVYVGNTIEYITGLTLLSGPFMANSKEVDLYTKKQEIIKRLKQCNSYYRKFGR